MDTLHSRLRHARVAAGFPSARAAALRHGWSPSTYGAHENGQNSFDADTAIIYAKAFSCDAAWLALGETREKQQLECEILGIARNPDEIELIINDKGLSANRIATMSFHVPSPSKALWISGDGFWPRYGSRDLVIIRKADLEESSVQRLVGEECFVWTKTNDKHLRRISEFKPQTGLLLSAHNRASSLRLELNEIREIWYTAMIVPFPNWSTLDLQMEHAEARNRVIGKNPNFEHE